MTPGILNWLTSNVLPYFSAVSEVAEIGALNINGSARDILQRQDINWTGLDREAGPCVDVVCQAAGWLSEHRSSFDCVISCESYEHDPSFWITNQAARDALRTGGLYIVTTPTIGFPYHSHGGDFWRFTEDAFRRVFFADWEILRMDTIPDTVGNNCIAAIGRRR
jgi:hypothetical protein